jgi:hypothetical protein
LLQSTSLRTHSVSIEVDQRIELRIESVDLSNVLFSKLKWRYLLSAEHRQHLDSGTQDHTAH